MGLPMVRLGSEKKRRYFCLPYRSDDKEENRVKDLERERSI